MICLRPYDASDDALRASILALLSDAFGEEGMRYYELAMDHLYDPDHTFLLSEEDASLVAVALVVDYVAMGSGRTSTASPLGRIIGVRD